jgi:hypothetical protein
MGEILPRWLKLKDASRYSAIGKQRLIKLAEHGLVSGFQDPDSGRSDWIFDRLSLDHYRMSQSGDLEIEAKALDILRRLDNV